MEKSKIIRDYLIDLAIFIIIVLVIVFAIRSTFVHREKIHKYEYDTLKQETIDYLNKNESELKIKCQKVLEDKPHPCREDNDLTYCYKNDDSVDVIFREYGKYKDNRDYVGEQDWGLIYANKDILEGKDKEIYDQHEKEGYGNNIFIKVKIKDNWYFYYGDYNYEKTDVISDYR